MTATDPLPSFVTSIIQWQVTERSSHTELGLTANCMAKADRDAVARIGQQCANYLSPSR